MKKSNSFTDSNFVKEKTNDEVEYTIEEAMEFKLQNLVLDRNKFLNDLSVFIHKKGTSNKRLLKIIKYALFRNTDFREKVTLKAGPESALGEQFRNILDDEMTIGYLQFSLASQIDDKLKNENEPTLNETVTELEEKGIDIPDYAKQGE